MLTRYQLVLALIVVELAIVSGMVISIRGDGFARSAAPAANAIMGSVPHLIEDGPHQIFATGMRPALTVDIGYADLTIVTHDAPQVDVSVSHSMDLGFMRNRSLITARKDGANVRIGKFGDSGFSMGDDRMVTILVPPETPVTVINAGVIRATGLRAEASFNSVGNGSITIEDYNAPGLHVASSNGRIVLHQIVAARLDASSSNGRVEGTDLHVRDGNVESSNGRVTLAFAPGTDTVVSAKTSNGRIRVSGIATAVANATRKSSDDDDDDDDESAQTVRIGSGNGHLDVHSSNGNIDLSQDG
jgi:hypothetical protein